MAQKPSADFKALLNQGLRPHQVRLERRHVEELARHWPTWLSRQESRDSDSPLLLAARYLMSRLSFITTTIVALREGQSRFSRRYAAAASKAERQRVILDYSGELGATPRQLRADKRAFKRWFGPDAAHDRSRVRISDAERTLTFVLQSLGRMAAFYLGQAPDQRAAWDALVLEQHVQPLLAWEGDARVRTEAFNSLSSALKAVAPELAMHAISDVSLAYIYRAALDRRLDVWIQREALLLLSCVAFDQLAQVLEQRLREPSGGDDLFVRRAAVELLGASLHRAPQLERLYAVAIGDSSAFVRQAIATSLVLASDQAVVAHWPRLGLDDAMVQVRAAALLQLPHLLRSDAMFACAANWLRTALAKESTLFGLRVALKAAEDGAAASGNRQQDWIDAVLPSVERLHVECPQLMVRRWAAEARERILCLCDPATRALAGRIRTEARAVRPGTSWRPCDLPIASDQLGRVLSCVVQRDHGIGLELSWRGWRAWRGHRFGFRLWRLLHEWQHPSPDKRQAQTKVPGEPLHMGSEAGWRPYLPLVDELISLLDESPAAGPLRVYTAEGVTEVQPPVGMTARLSARLTLTRHFARFADARNWNEGSAAHPASYARTIAELGFELRFAPHKGTLADPAVTRFFPGLAALPLPLLLPMPELTGRMQNYFFSAYDNTLFDLSVFVALGITGFIGHHLWVNFQMSRARNAIPLVVGGWGTRGKSGTERLKAAMFNAMGYSVVSKTTGCEAMFLYSPPQGDLREMFLFRPYDKATIWEQYNVVRIARKLGCDVFLWECMALTPAFVRLLQRAWMRDDIVTLTNTFPDHEDVQGPAGIDIPKVMTEFIPKRRVLLTTEEQMRPILQEAADALGTELKGVGWLESGLIAPDVLDRFPYQEHPDNIALVIALGAELGVPHDYAVKAMADRVVPDLGVLKTFAPALLNRRALEFSNGMSANERYGCLGNWKRLGFDKQDAQAEPGVMISTVVNNRADRVARSRVFAGVLVQDIRADFHVLIGSNLDGLRGYLRETWAAYAPNLTLWPEQGGEQGAGAAFETLARDFRIVHTEAQLAARLAVMLAGIGADPGLVAHSGDGQALTSVLSESALVHSDEVLAFHDRDVKMLQEYTGLLRRCQQAGVSPDPTLDGAMREQLWRWFEQRVIVVQDYYATGDAVIAAIRDATPPGFHNRVMGLQNIKGTGLDFVYRWLAWGLCQRACQELSSSDPLLRRRGLSALGGFQEYGLLSHETVVATLATVRTSSFGQQDRVRGELAVIEDILRLTMRTVLEGINAKRSTGWLDKALEVAEGFVDAADAVRRRRRADQIYRDLVARRISEARAVLELQGLTRRQKGGWLSAAVVGVLEKLRRRLLQTKPV
jgi:poly-gamma-glutamate synthase PgsB/CapB